jgi:3-hydroxyisobutyrate dehydrogenase
VKVGFIGLGTMGQHMAANLQAASYELVVHDIRASAAEPHLAAGAVWSETPAEVMAAADVVFTSLPTPAVVEEVALGVSGLLRSAREGKVLFDLSTNSPTTIRQIERAFRDKGGVVCDAPVSGGPSGARRRKLSVYVGGDRDAFDVHRDLLSAFSDEQLYVGPIGSGTVAKLAHNCVGYMINVAIAEVFTLGVRGGVDPLDLWRALRAGAVGRRRTFDALATQFLSHSFDVPAFSLRLAHKDVGLANEFAREMGIPLRMAGLTFAEMTEALARGWGDRDSRVAMLLQEERAGVHIEIPADILQQELEG